MAESRICPSCHQRQHHFGTAWVHNSKIAGQRCALIQAKRAEAQKQKRMLTERGPFRRD